METPSTNNALVAFEWTAEREALLKRTICDGGTPDEFALFLGHCKRTGLDPFAGQIHAVMRRNNKKNRDEMKMQTGIDGLRLIAQRTGDYEGQAPKQWCGADGKWIDVWLAPENPKAARAGVWRKGFKEPLYAVALWDEYAQTYQDGGTTRLTKFWANMDAHMLAKCAEALALRQAFPQEMSDLYLKEELNRRQTMDAAPTPPPRRASDPAPAEPSAEDAAFVPAFGTPSQAPAPEPTPPPAAPEPPPTPGPSLPNSGAAQAPTPPPRTNAPTGPVMEFDDTITRTNSKDIGKGRTKYGICTGSGRWINTINDDAGRRANRLKGTNIQAKFKIVKNDYGFELVEMQEIPPGGLK